MKLRFAFFLLLALAHVAKADRTMDIGTVGPAVSGTRSTLAIVDPRTSELQLFRSVDDAAPTATAKVSSQPTSVQWKQSGDKGYFVTLCSGDGAIYVHDDQTAKQLAKFQVDGNAPDWVFLDPRITSPYIYYVGGRSPEEGKDKLVGRIDLSTLTDDGWLPTSKVTDRSSQRFRLMLAADGRTVYGLRAGTSPSGIFRMQLDEPVDPQTLPTLTQLIYRHDSWSEVVPDPAGRFVAAHGQVYSFNATETLGKLDGSPLCALTQRPVLFVWKGAAIEALSTNDFRVLSRVDMTGYVTVKVDPKRRTAPTIFDNNNNNGTAYNDKNLVVLARADEASGRLVVRMRTQMFEIPLRDFNLPDEPVLAAPIQGPASATIGQPWSGAVKAADPRTKVTLASAPQGAIFRDGKITWTPTEAQVGTHRIELAVQWTNLTVKQSVEVNVGRPSLQLPFRPQVFCISPDGSKSLAVQLSGDERFGQSPRENSVQSPTVVLIDNKSLRIIATRTLPEAIGTATLTEDQVIVSLRNSAVLKVLSVKDLSEQRQVFTKAIAGYFTATPNLLFLRGYNGQAPEIFSLPDIKPVTLLPAMPEMFGDRQGTVVLSDGRLGYGGLQFDLTTLKPIGLSLPGTTAFYGNPSLLQNTDMRYDQTATAVFSFGGRIAQNSLFRISKPPIQMGSDRGGDVGTVLPDVPVVAMLSVVTDNHNYSSNRVRRVRATLTIRDMVVGKVLSEIALMDEPVTFEPVASHDAQHAYRLNAVPGTLIVTVADRVFRIDTRDITTLKPPMPLLLRGKPKLTVVDQKSQTMEWEVVGGKPPYRFELAETVPGVTVRADQPAVTIDPKAFARDGGSMLWQRVTNGLMGGPDIKVRFNAYGERERKRLAEMLGVKLDGVPVAAVISLRVSDSENQSYTASEFVLLNLPQSAFQSQMEEAAKQEADRPPRGGNDGAGPNRDAALRRIRELEQENAKLRAQVELLTDLVMNRPTTRPND